MNGSFRIPCGPQHEMTLILTERDADDAGQVAADAFNSSLLGEELAQRLKRDVRSGIFDLPVYQQLNPVPRRYYLARTLVDHRAVGISGLYRLEWAWRRSYWLGWFAVRCELQGQGLGSLMLQNILRIAKAEGAVQLKVETARDSRATGFYLKSGFTIEGHLRRHYAEDLDATILNRDLDDICPFE